MRDLLTRRRTVLTATAGVLVIAGAVAALVFHGGHAGRTEPAAGPTPSSLPTSLGPVNLLHGTHEVDGVAVGYPRTTLGAISAAAEYVGDLTSTLDPNYAAAIGRVVGDPGVPGLSSDFAHGAVRGRAELSLPTSGSLPAGVAFYTTAQMYQLRQAGADRVLVLLLATGTFANGAGGMASTTGVFPTLMRWTHGDWKLVGIGTNADATNAANEAALNATPDSPAASAKGWAPLLAPTAGAS